MYVSIPPRFGVSAAAGAATVATQKTAPRPAATNPDFLIISSLPLVVGMDRWRHPLPRFPAKHAGIQRRNAAARRTSRSSGRIRLQLSTAIGQRMKHAARRRTDRARHLTFHGFELAVGLDARIRHRHRDRSARADPRAG